MRFLFFALLLLFVTAGFAQEPSKTQVIRKITVKGNPTVNAGLITGNFTLKPGDRYSPKDAQESIRALYEMGLFADVLLDAEDASGDTFNLVITVKEYPLLDHLEFSGNNKFDNKELEEKINLLPGSVITAVVLNKAKNTILAAYKEKGFLLAEVNVKTYESKESGKSVAEFAVTEGKKVAIGRITLNGCSAIPEKKVKKAMQDTKEDRWWRSGDIY